MTFVVPEGMPRSVFHNKYSRKKEDGTYETWEERVKQVVDGNYSLEPEWLRANYDRDADYEATHSLARDGVMIFSGRHLQHGDAGQKEKMGEVFTNCSTAMFSFVKFWLLLKGSGVGRCYDSDMCRVNWDFMPNVRFVLKAPEYFPDFVPGHPDYEDWIESSQSARHKYDSESDDVRWFEVGDSAEGWCKVVEILETAAYQKKHVNKLFIFDFTPVRHKGVPMSGQQGRPASGPIPFIKALMQVARIKGSGMKPWKQAMFIDHFLSEVVQLGGARRSARIGCKTWKDKDIFEFIDIKRGGWLWSANNSVTLDEEFWEQARSPHPSHGRRVYEAMCSAGYFDRTGEPGALNLHHMTWKRESSKYTGAGRDVEPDTRGLTDRNYFSKRIQSELDIHPRTLEMAGDLLHYALRKKYPFIVNPCVAGDTLVETTKGMIPVTDLIGKEFTAIVQGEEVVVPGGFFKTKHAEVFELVTDSGNKIRATLDHEFCVEDGAGGEKWAPLGDLYQDHEVVLSDGTRTHVASVLPAGMEDVYDCTVPGFGEFGGNGLRVHNCGEIVLAIWGGYCTIGDICMANITDLDQGVEAGRLMARFLMRTNTMNFMYEYEVGRTNRIGVGLTGIFEFAYRHFGFTFFDLIDETVSAPFWDYITRVREAVESSAREYADVLSVRIPHTKTTCKPSGTVSKLMACTEGAHLPAYGFYIRWVQYPHDSPEVQEHRDRGYPVKDISAQYPGQVVVGFPTALPIGELMGEDLVVASDPTIAQHYKWLQLLEKHWLGGPGNNNQISYTLKYDPEKVPYQDFMQAMLDGQQTVRACSIMPQEDTSAYIYLPEEKIDRDTYVELISKINRFEMEAYDKDALMCEGGACPIEYDIN